MTSSRLNLKQGKHLDISGILPTFCFYCYCFTFDIKARPFSMLLLWLSSAGWLWVRLLRATNMHKLHTHTNTNKRIAVRAPFALKLDSHNSPMIHRCFCCCSSTKTADALNANAPLQFIGILWGLLFFQLSHTHTRINMHMHARTQTILGLRMLGAACLRSRHLVDLCQCVCFAICVFCKNFVYFLHPSSIFFNVFYFYVVVRDIYVLVTYHKYFKVTCTRSRYRKIFNRKLTISQYIYLI